MSHDCIFCKIARREAPSAVIFEDDLTLAFLPLQPMTRGHIILTPKEHFENYVDMPENMAIRMTKNSIKLGKITREKFNPKKVGYAVAGFEINHTHLHIIPLYNMFEITSSIYAKIKDGEINWSSENVPFISDEQRSEIQKIFAS